MPTHQLPICHIAISTISTSTRSITVRQRIARKRERASAMVIAASRLLLMNEARAAANPPREGERRERSERGGVNAKRHAKLHPTLIALRRSAALRRSTLPLKGRLTERAARRAVLPPRSKLQEERIASSLRFLPVDRREQRLDRHGLLDQRLIGEILHQRFERRPVGLDAVGPRIAAEHLIDLLELGGHPRQHVTQRSELAHLLRGDRLGLAERVKQARRHERVF